MQLASTGLTATDLFCGAGGSALGLEAAGIDVKMAANHWRLAVETHALNFPKTEHDVADISQVDPRRYPATDILWASPECTNLSSAQGKSAQLMRDRMPANGERPLPRDAAERSRATMWDVPRFVEAMMLRGQPYRAIIVENVVEARTWGPSRNGALFDAWVMAMDGMGYDHQTVYLNSAFAGGGRFAGIVPAPQFRDRLYVVFTPKGARKPDLDIRPDAPCTRCETVVHAIQSWKRPEKQWGKYRQQYVYRCPICQDAVEPFTVPALAAIDWTLKGERIGDRGKPLADGTMRRIQAGLDRYGGRELLIPLDRNNDERKRARTVDEAFPTLTTRATLALAAPFVASLRGGGSKKKVDSVVRPLATVSAGGNHHMLINPDPDTWAMTLSYYRTGRAHPVTEPVGTLTTRDRHAVVIPPGFVMRNNGSHGRPGGEHCTPFDDPIRTLTTKGHQSLVVSPSERVAIEDCEFRMLQPHEQGTAMAFPSSYQVVGTKRERTRQYGNAVTPPASQILATAVAVALADVRGDWDALVA
jgi:DNA (cytosine-5)-methyltransferase 1